MCATNFKDHKWPRGGPWEAAEPCDGRRPRDAPLCWPDYVHAVTPTNLVGGLKIQANPIIRHQPSS